MTPFGAHLRQLRAERGMTQKQLAHLIGVSPAYLSALEHGHRGKPSFDLIQRIAGRLHIIWDDAERLHELAEQSEPRVLVDTAGLSADATRVANLMARHIGQLDQETLEAIAHMIAQRVGTDPKTEGD